MTKLAFVIAELTTEATWCKVQVNFAINNQNFSEAVTWRNQQKKFEHLVNLLKEVQRELEER